MGIRTICEEGYPLDICRCRSEHKPFRVKPCPPNHRHAGPAMTYEGKALSVAAPVATVAHAEEPPGERVCDRCCEGHPAEEFRGGVCGFCADQLEAIDAAGDST